MVDVLHRGFDRIAGEGPTPRDFLSTPKASPRQELWGAVLLQAWLDAFGGAESFTGKRRRSLRGQTRRDRARQAESIRDETRNWFFSDRKSDREDRELVCWLAGFDPQWVQDMARKRLAVEESESMSSAEVIKIDQAFEKLLSRESKMTPAQISSELERLAAIEAA